jgi:hypothetical protein
MAWMDLLLTAVWLHAVLCCAVPCCAVLCCAVTRASVAGMALVSIVCCLGLKKWYPLTNQCA